MTNPDRKKDYFAINGGLNTEASEIGFPDGFSPDMTNYELLVDGSLRKRKGLAAESGGSNLTVPSISTSQRMRTYKWRAVNGDPNENQIVVQVGTRLYFMDDTDTPSATWKVDYVELADHAAPNATSTNIANTPVTFSQHRGYLLVCSRYIEPLHIGYDSANDDYDVFRTKLRIRDFEGIDDGVSPLTEPATLSDAHRYNLLNRGWKQDDIDDYKTNSSGTTYPSKTMIWWKGYRRADVTGYTADPDSGTHEWSTAKMEAERVDGNDAPQGALLFDPFDTSFAATALGTAVAIDTWSFTSSTQVTINFASAHGVSAGPPITPATVTITGNDYSWFNADDGSDNYSSLDGTWTVDSVTDADTLVILYNQPSGFDSFITQYINKGQIGEGEPAANPEGQAFDERPAVVEAHQGHIFYAGVPNSEYADTIFFSQTARKRKQFGWCYQEADPTSPDVNQLVPTDGGLIVLPGLGQVKEMLSLRNGLLVFSDQGVWEITGRQGIFTADGYFIRKITDAECASPYSVQKVDDTIIYAGYKGILALSPNIYTSILEAQNITEERLQTLWNGLTQAEQEKVFTVYDDAKRRLYFLYDDGTNGNQYIACLILDLRVGAWSKYTFNSSSTDGILGAVAITGSDNAATNAKIKFLCMTTATALTTCDFNQTSFTDFDGAAMPTAYFYTGWDNIGDFQSRKQAPIITVYQARTETGYTSTGNGFDPVNESSTTMKGFWDWVDDTVTGKITSGQEVYRHVRQFVPSGPTDEDGYPLVVTRNKLRGRGRVLQLYFEAGAGKDSHVKGFTVNYSTPRRV